MKKGLAYIGGSRQLKDFIWMYLYLGKEYEWTLICQPMFPEMKLKEVCEKTGLFKKIIMADAYITKTKKDLAVEFGKMFLFWIFGKRKYYAKKTIDKLVDIDDYDIVVVSTTRGVTCGMMVLASECENIILMEDGLGDNTNPNEKLKFREIFKPSALMEYVSAQMGYFNINGRFPLKSSRKCHKYTEYLECNYPELYKSLNRLNDMSKVSDEEYEQLVNRTFGSLDEIKNYDVIVFTSNMGDFSANWDELNNKAIGYIEKNNIGKRIIIKKHPRDLSVYHFHKQEAYELDSMIPAENIIPHIENMKIYFFYPSTTIKSMKNMDCVINVFCFKDLLDNNYSEGGKFNYKYSFNRALELCKDEGVYNKISFINI